MPVSQAGALPGQSGGSAPAIRKDVRVSEAVVEAPERRGVLSRINWRDVILVLAISLDGRLAPAEGGAAQPTYEPRFRG
jgi:hypothetical protein